MRYAAPDLGKGARDRGSVDDAGPVKPMPSGKCDVGERQYDALVVGGGHNGLSLGVRLAEAGLSTLLLERTATVGGMSRSEDVFGTGSVHHAHANFLSFEDCGAIGCEALGVPTILPEVQHGIAFRDGTAPVLLYDGGHADRTGRSLARHSRRDAARFAEVKRRADTLGPAIARAMFAVPTRDTLEAQQAAIRRAYVGLDLNGCENARAVIDRLFRSPAVRTLFYMLALELGGSLTERGSDLAFLGFVMWVIGRRRLPAGGMGSVSRGLAQRLTELGGTIETGADVTTIMIEDGRAAGVRLADGRQIDALRLVAASAPLAETCTRLLPRGSLRGRDATDVRRFIAADAPASGTMRVDLATAPHYRSAVIDPDVDRCAQLFIGLDTPAEVLEHAADIAAGRLPAPAGAVRINALWDPAQASPGRHAAGADCSFPAPVRMGAAILEQLPTLYPAAFLDMWRDYAPNLSGSAVLACRFDLDADYERKLMLRTGPDQYRLGVERLYLCGAATYPGGGVHGACAANAFAVIAADLGIATG